jgi:hypothetical protein
MMDSAQLMCELCYILYRTPAAFWASCAALEIVRRATTQPRQNSVRQHDWHAAMVYKWAQHQALCRRLYVDEDMKIQEVMDYMREHHNFTPR